MEGNSLVSVIIPNYNHARYLPQRINTVLQQSYTNLEILILDDCSPDNSREIIKHYAERDARIKLVFNETNSGSTFKQWDKGIGLSKGEYIWIAESDDFADVTFIETMLKEMTQDARVVLAYSDSYSVDEHGVCKGTHAEALSSVDTSLWKQDFILEGSVLIRRFMSYCNVIPNASAVLIRRSAAQQAGPAAASFRILGDWLYWVKILSLGKVAYKAKPLNYFRTHSNNVRSSTMSDGTILEEVTKTLLILKDFGPLEPTLYRKKIAELHISWFNALVHAKVPLKRHMSIFNNINKIDAGLGLKVASKVFLRLFDNRLSGIKIIIGDKLLKLNSNR